MKRLTERELSAGVVAASAGNHAQGVGLAASRLGCKATIVMPQTTPGIKVAAVRRWGAEVVLHGDSYSDAAEYAAKLSESGKTFIHPFDDEDVIAGQGTVGLEIIRQFGSKRSDVHAVFIPIGGGGLVAGVGVFLKQVCPNIRVIGVEPYGSSAMKQSIDAGTRVTLSSVDVFADGVAVKTVGKETFRLTKMFCDEIVLCDNDEICAAIKDVFEDTRTVLEPAGALSVAGMRKYIAEKGLSKKTFCAITTGANMNFDRLQYIAERANFGRNIEHVVGVVVPEGLGALANFCSVLGDSFVTEMHYQFTKGTDANIFVGLAVPPGKISEILGNMTKANFKAQDFSQNDFFKSHFRYMMGGLPGIVENEKIFRIEFPERNGALGAFLEAMKGRWNITRFHYRTQGDVGRVLIGLQLAVPADVAAFESVVGTLGWRYESMLSNEALCFFPTTQQQSQKSKL
eukprot:TRINITY_DN4395_c0_g1_i3.p1 TRINITY_DN4395_c0_g1~~TRINITY_DN4395_c0_g1_i3.p1  ORF type:complete len:516 (-),score=134.64 TRINITY_DN4395_c0_g1_i3:15-1385(-)